jgi:hypothetical protein
VIPGHFDEAAASRTTTPWSCCLEIRLVDTYPGVDVPVQPALIGPGRARKAYFQSIIAIELGVAGALLWEIRFFESSSTAWREGEHVPDPRLGSCSRSSSARPCSGRCGRWPTTGNREPRPPLLSA